MRNQDIIDGLDVFKGDMADHQKAVGLIPTAEDNAALAADLYRKMDNDGSNEQAISSNRAADAVAVDMAKFQDWTITKQADDEPVKPVDDLSARALKRFRFLMNQREGTPSWRDRAMYVQRFFPLRNGPHYHELLRRYTFELSKLLTESDRYFGNWKLDFTPDANETAATWDPR